MLNSDRRGALGPTSLVDELLTREARWFVGGLLPSSVAEWFTAAPDVESGERVDTYDLESARRGIGRKHRNGESVDVKVRVRDLGDIPLADRLVGRLEDWRKVSRTADPSRPRLVAPMEVAKALHTRRFPLPGSDAGCEAELVQIEAAGATAWSLCFETYGDPTLRARAFRQGVDRFLAETPIPADLEFGPQCSLSYPALIARVGS